ncbi:recombination protein RecR [Candidatus Parcubacteria bacterium]|nr:recombination protein RecR [Candidatus Parcubacteria bacterium]
MKYPHAIESLISQFSQLPTVGPKTAERYVFYLLTKKPEELAYLGNSISTLKNNLSVCKNCFTISEESPCKICSDKSRNSDILCIVSRPQDMHSIESTKEFNGLYHILGGTINTIEGIGPEQLTIKQLVNKIKKQDIKEVVLALSPTLEGETTSMYITKLIKEFFEKVLITRLAKGLPMGADLEYADEITLSNALKYRNKL